MSTPTIMRTWEAISLIIEQAIERGGTLRGKLCTILVFLLHDLAIPSWFFWAWYCATLFIFIWNFWDVNSLHIISCCITSIHFFYYILNFLFIGLLPKLHFLFVYIINNLNNIATYQLFSKYFPCSLQNVSKCVSEWLLGNEPSKRSKA